MPKSFQGSAVIETGLSDFDKLTLSIMTVFYKKQKPNIIKYQNYKNFENSTFMSDVKNKVSELDNEDQLANFDLFKNTVFHVFENYAPLKKRYVRANQSPFIN